MKVRIHKVASVTYRLGLGQEVEVSRLIEASTGAVLVVRALEEKRDTAIRCSSEVTYRLWRLYMAGCAFYFDEGSIGLHQVLAGHQHQLQPVPLRRDDLYTRGDGNRDT